MRSTNTTVGAHIVNISIKEIMNRLVIPVNGYMLTVRTTGSPKMSKEGEAVMNEESEHHGKCGYCKHLNKGMQDPPCDKCKWAYVDRPDNWEPTDD